MGENEVQLKLDRVLGLLAVVTARQGEMSSEIRELSTTVTEVKVEVGKTKEVVEAWTTAKTSLRFAKWFAGFLAALVAAAAAMKGYWHK